MFKATFFMTKSGNTNAHQLWLKKKKCYIHITEYYLAMKRNEVPIHATPQRNLENTVQFHYYKKSGVDWWLYKPGRRWGMGVTGNGQGFFLWEWKCSMGTLWELWEWKCTGDCIVHFK